MNERRFWDSSVNACQDMITVTQKFGTLRKLIVYSCISILTHRCAASQKIKCICENMNEQNFCYKTSCFTRVDDNETFSFIHNQQEFLHVQCKTDEPLNANYFKTQVLHAVTQIEFNRCNVPNGIFSGILRNMPLKLLIFKSRSEIKHLRRQIISNFPLLEKLKVSYSGIEDLPPDTFNTVSHLQVLDLSDNHLQTLPPGIFSHLSNLTTLYLRNNYLSSIPESLFNGLDKLEMLDLSNNRLRQIPKTAFYSLKSLQTLKLIGNEMTELEEDVLSNNSELQNLDMSRNNLRHLPEKLLHNATKLIRLYISGNPLATLPGNFLLWKPSLEVFELNSCDLTSLPPNFFENAPNLSNLSMYNNGLKTMQHYLFAPIKHLKYLDLSFNDISDLIHSPFWEQKELQKLKLYRNNLSKISKNYFKGLTSLASLDISSNFIKSVDAGAFADLGNLVTINISNNAISSIEGGQPFGPSEKLRKIDISGNELTCFPDDLETYLLLEELRAQNNKISVFMVPILISIKTKVYLQNNQIVLVNVSLLNKADKMQPPTTPDEDIPTFYLENNPFNCDCDLHGFYNYLPTAYSNTHSARFLDGHKLICRSPWNLKGQKMLTLKKEEYVCNITEKCPKPCVCSIRACDNVVAMNCNRANLDRIPDIAPYNVSILKLQNNNLSSLNGLGEKRWKKLTEIYLDDNFIPSDDWKIPPQLQLLSITKNQLTLIPDSVKHHANVLQSFKMRIADNPLRCSCPLKTWISEHFKQVINIEEVRCIKHNENNTETSLALMNTTDNVLCPIDEWPQRLHLILYISSCVIVAIIIITIIALYYRNKRTVLAYIYTHFHCVFECFYRSHDFDEDKIFDAFISYSSTDRDVTLQLIEEMENKPPHYKLCVHERDWIPGNLITNNIVNSVQNSKKTILVISKQFLESVWFQVEFHTAYYQMMEDKIDRLIVILKGELPPTDSLDKDLRRLLSTKTYIVWGEKWFWEKLRYAMPYKGKGCTLCSTETTNQSRVKVPKEDKISLIYSQESTLPSQDQINMTPLHLV